MQKDNMRCPGQDTMFWKPGDIYDVKCPSCGAPVEFWKDDNKRTCKCGHRFLNPKRDLGCLEYCKYAEDCMPELFQGENLTALYRDRLLAAVKSVLKTEDARPERGQEVLELVEEILEGEDGEPKVAIAAAIFGDLLGSRPRDDGTDQPAQPNSRHEVTRRILADLGTEKEVIDQICRIIDDRIDGTCSQEINSRIVSDALELAGLFEQKSLLDEPSLEGLAALKLKTETGRRIAQKRLLAGRS